MLRCCTILSCSVLFVLFAAAADAGELYLDVSTTDATNTKPIVITVSGIGQCPSVSDPLISDGVIILEFSDGCPILPPAPGRSRTTSWQGHSSQASGRSSWST